MTLITSPSRMVGGIELVHAGAQFVYSGGAVDYGHRQRTHLWRHRLESPTWAVYCPICANDDFPDLQTLMMRNELALFTAARCVFLLDGMFTVGTPVEIYQRITHRPPPTVCLIHPGDPGAFVRTWAAAGAAVVQSVEEAIEWLGA